MTPATITPTVGRKVWFRPNGITALQKAGTLEYATDHLVINDGQPLDATVVYVWNDRMVNLTVLDHCGHTFLATSVPMLQEGDEQPASGYYCEWMPYQKGQAAKAEATTQAGMTLEPTRIDQRDQLEYVLVSGAAARLADVPHEAAAIATGIKNVLNALHPLPVVFNPHTGTPRDPRDVASDPQALLCVKPGEPLMAASVTLPVVDPGPDSLEREIQAKANKAPRVTPADIEAEIVSEHYFTAEQGAFAAFDPLRGSDIVPPELSLLTFCVLLLRNGFTVTGESACASPENFNADIGRRIARESAVSKVWPLLGFRLRDQLAAGQLAAG